MDEETIIIGTVTKTLWGQLYEITKAVVNVKNNNRVERVFIRKLVG